MSNQPDPPYGRPAAVVERRPATVLFADLAGFTAFSERRGEEAAYSLMQRISTLMTVAIHAQGGTVRSFTGDGLMALFGVPVAFEDAPLRACRAALEIQKRIRSAAPEIETSYDLQPEVRIGINTGLVVVGEVESGDSTTVTAIGDTVNLASRLQSLAKPGSVVLSEATHRLVQGLVETRPAGEHAIKGKTERQKIFELRRIRKSAVRFDAALSRGLTAYVGRARELEVLERQLEETAHGLRVTCLVGEPGIGKSRLIHEFCSRITEKRVFALSGNCTPDGQQTPFLPFINVVRGSFRVSEGEAEADVARKLDNGLSMLGLASAQNLALLLNLLGLKASDEALKGLDGVLIGLRTRGLLLELLHERCQTMPGVLILEDLHWIDSASEELIGRMIAEAEKLQLTIILTYRPEYRPPWIEQRSITTLPVEPLSAAETSQIIRSRVGVANLPAPLARLVTDRADGNPLFAEEIVSHLVERGLVQSGTEGVNFDANAVAAALPTSIQGLLTARMDRLAPDDRALLQAASVIGRTFDRSLLGPIMTQGMDIDARLVAMQELGFIFKDERTELWTFKHALVRDVAYQGLLTTARIALHLKTAEEIERRGSNRLHEVAEHLAYHYDRAGSSTKAFRFNVLAAEKSFEVYSLDEAENYFQRALVLFESQTDCAEGFAALVASMSALFHMKFAPRKTKELVDRHSARLTALGDDAQIVIIYCYYSIAAFSMCQYREAVHAAINSLEMAERLGDDRSKAYGRCGYLITKAMLGELSLGEAESHGKLLALESERVGDPHLQIDAITVCAWDYFNRGMTDKGRASALELQNRGRRIRDPRALATSLWLLGWLDILDERYDEAFSHGDEGARLAITPFDRLISAEVKAIAQIFRGDVHEGAARLTEVRQQGIEKDYQYIKVGADGPLGVAKILLGDFKGGLSFLEQAVERNDHEGNGLGSSLTRVFLAEVLIEMMAAKKKPPLRVIVKNLSALVRVAFGGWSRALALLNTAHGNPMFSGVSLFRARIETDLGILYMMKKQHIQAKQYLGQARSIAEQLSSAALLAKIDAAMANLA